MDERIPGEDEGGFDVDLARFDEEFASATVDEGGLEPVLDGSYQVSVERVELTTAKTSRHPMLKWTLRILGPQFKGRMLWRNNMIVTKENIRWLKHDLHVCGLVLDRLSDLPANLERLLDVKLEVTKRTKGPNENVYLNRRIVDSAGEPATGGGNVPGLGHDNIPF